MELSRALRVQPGDVVAFTGGGGKTTAMFRLAAEQAALGRRVLVTTSTRIFAAQIRLAPDHLAFDPARHSLPQLLDDLADRGANPLLLTGPVEPESGKAPGVSPDLIDALAAGGLFDAILIEADGSRMRPFKAPAAHEPVIPARTTLAVPVAGLDVLGAPLDEAHVHRAARVSALTGLPLDRPVTGPAVARLLTHPGGGLKGVPAGARVVPLLNKIDLAGTQAESEGREGARRLPTAAGSGGHPLWDSARAIAARLLEAPRLQAVAIGAARAGEPVAEVRGRVAAVVLAAGGSSRFGSPKQLAPWGRTTFIERVVDVALASQARPVIVVLGAGAEACRRQLGRRPVQVVVNERWAEGQSTSMRAGLAALPPNVEGAIFPLVDQPGVPAPVFDALIERHAQTLAPVVWPEFEGRRGNPVLFDRSLFPEMAAVGGDTGARPVLLRWRASAERVAVPEAGVVQDFDRPEDLPHP
ncbi:MAG: selenium cofactor biosynthesis protein YqeC [Anaerolineae bacterium]